jgi:peptidoglycan hydrolase-like protein with peptidoglycan-binding domain
MQLRLCEQPEPNHWRTEKMIRSVALMVTLVSLSVLAGCGGNSAPTTTVTTTVTPTTTVSAANPAVAQLQLAMTSLGYYSGPIDGVYGSQTSAAVKAMQQALGVSADGIFGPETYVALKANVKTAAVATSVVVSIQTTLKRYGYYSGPIDGVYGADTTAAVKHLQTDLGLTADGRVGPQTVATFNKAVANGTIKPVSG